MKSVSVDWEILGIGLFSLALTVLLDRFCKFIVGKLVIFGFRDRSRLLALWMFRITLFFGLFAVAFFYASVVIFKI